MAKDNEIADQMVELVEQLSANAQQLVDHSTGTISEDQLAELQEQQQALITALNKLDRKQQKSGEKPLSDAWPKHWKKIEEHLELFAELNEVFIQNLQVRKGLIQFDLNQVKKARKTVSDVKGAYGQAPRRSRRINRLS